MAPVTAWLVGLLTMVCAGVLAPTASAAVEEFIGKPVVTVEFVSDGRPMPDRSVLELVETRVGVPLSMRQVRASVMHLFSLGQFESVQVDGSLRSDGVALQYELVPRQLIDRVEVDGDVGVSPGDVRRAITEAHGPEFRADQAATVVETLRRFYRERGFLRAQFEMRVEGQGASRMLHVTANAGDRAEITQLTVRGVSATMYPRVLARLGLQTGTPYDSADIERRLSDYEGELRQLRYYEAVMSHDIEAVDGGSAVQLLLDLQRGPRITIEFAGDPIPGGDPAELVSIEREASVDEDLLEDSDRRIARRLQDVGYRDAKVTHIREADGDELSVVFAVDRGRRYEIGEVVFRGNTVVPGSTLGELVGLELGAPLVMRELETGLANVAEHYHQQGHATVRVEPVLEEMEVMPGREVEGGDAIRVSCAIDIGEGVRTTVQSVVMEGNEFRSDAELSQAITSQPGGPYYAQQVVSGRDAIRLLYLNNGFERVVVTVEPRFDETLEAADLVYRINEGPQIRIEHVLIVGNEQVQSETIRRELAIEEGEPLSLVEVSETRRRLNALGLFRLIDIREISHGGGNLRDVIVVVEEAPATRLGYGGGVEVSQRLRREAGAGGSQATERLEFAPRGFFEIGRRNLWGKNRSIDLFARVSVRRKNDPVDATDTTGSSSFGFNEYRILGTYQEPRTFGLLWDIFINGFVEQAIRPGFDLFSRGVNAAIRRQLTPSVIVSVSYGFGQNDTSSKELDPELEPLVDRLFPEVRLSSVSGAILRDTRDDQIDPSHGEVLSIDAEVAARAIGSQVGFAKTFMQGFLYRPVPGLGPVVFAGAARLGLAVGFPRANELIPAIPLDPEIDDVPASRQVFEFRSLPLSERFFAGGDTTVRGFALDRLGVPSGSPGATIDEQGFPQGGNAVIILNGELRVPVTRDLGLVGFVDAGNVYDLVSNISLGQVRGGIGFGVRYGSPFGPIRVDLGFKLDRQEFGSGADRQKERLTALHISIGQAF